MEFVNLVREEVSKRLTRDLESHKRVVLRSRPKPCIALPSMFLKTLFDVFLTTNRAIILIYF